MAEYSISIQRDGEVQSYTGKIGESLMKALTDNGIYLPAACGGIGRCGKCGVQLLAGAPEPGEGDRQCFSPDLLLAGWRLACTTFPEKDVVLSLTPSREEEFSVVSAWGGSDEAAVGGEPAEAEYDIAIDIGTTTLAFCLIGRESRTILHTVSGVNHQRAYGADVISRIQAANEGSLSALSRSIRLDLCDGIRRLLAETRVGAERVRRIAIAGNTTMGHLLMGYSCESLGVYPFTPVNISTVTTDFAALFGQVAGEADGISAEVILLPGISTYVGGDIAAGLLCCDFDTANRVNVLMDLGTNGEMAIGNQERILVTSTAAGPAFEGGNISWGMGSVPGAICRVSLNQAEVTWGTIDDKEPVGLCGTGVMETVYELLTQEWIDETGLLEEEYFDDGFPLAKTPEGEEITFSQKDVREVQLAKAAVRAGLETLLLRYGIGYDDIDTLYLAGGFGYRMDLTKAAGIGLFPEELLAKTRAVGNTALGGAVAYLQEENAACRLEKLISISTEISLAADKDFMRHYTEQMFFS